MRGSKVLQRGGHARRRNPAVALEPIDTRRWAFNDGGMACSAVALNGRTAAELRSRRWLRHHGDGARPLGVSPVEMLPMSERRTYKGKEKRVWRKRLRLEFRMKLAGQKPRMLRGFDNFHVLAVG